MILFKSIKTRLVIIKVNLKIKRLNELGIPIIFLVGGTNSTGKTTITRLLIQKCLFYQSVNLGIVSKLLRYLNPEIPFDNLENSRQSGIQDTYSKLITFMIKNYWNSGVNLIIEGVQVDTNVFNRNSMVIGGVLLLTNQTLAVKRGYMPRTHFRRTITYNEDLDINYTEYQNFIFVDNNGSLSSTFYHVLIHLNNILGEKISNLN